jgi:hypothetical protein
LEEDAEPEDEDDQPSGPLSRHLKKKPQATHGKGKSKAPEKGKEKAPLKCGPLSDIARNEAQELGDEVNAAMNKLANHHHTTPHTILIAAGFTIKELQAPNIFNQHAEWYSYHFPKTSEGTFPCLTNSIKHA